MSLNVFGSQPLAAFSEPAKGEGPDFRMAEHVGAVAIVKVNEVKQIKTEKYGEKPAIACDVTVLDAQGNGTTYADSLIFSAAVVSQMRGFAGQTVVAAIASYKSSYGTEGYKFDAPTPAALALAEAHQKAAA